MNDEIPRPQSTREIELEGRRILKRGRDPNDAFTPGPMEEKLGRVAVRAYRNWWGMVTAIVALVGAIGAGAIWLNDLREALALLPAIVAKQERLERQQTALRWGEYRRCVDQHLDNCEKPEREP